MGEKGLDTKEIIEAVKSLHEMAMDIADSCGEIIEQLESEGAVQ